MFGSRRWNPNIEPRDNYFVSFITHGEGYHNWHHEYPYDWRASKNEWYMINWTTTFISIMAALGLAKIKN
jgi:stearoyl-CoA desaturase (Delta-9 desaturase)